MGKLKNSVTTPEPKVSEAKTFEAKALSRAKEIAEHEEWVAKAVEEHFEGRRPLPASRCFLVSGTNESEPGMIPSVVEVSPLGDNQDDGPVLVAAAEQAGAETEAEAWVEWADTEEP